MAEAIGGNAQLSDFAKNIIGLEEVKRATLDQISEAYGAVKDAGFSVVALRKAIKEHLRTPEKVAKDEATEELAAQYKSQLKLF